MGAIVESILRTFSPNSDFGSILKRALATGKQNDNSLAVSFASDCDRAIVQLSN
jgi:hypothetical protein